MSSTQVTTTVWVDPSDAPELEVPTATETFARPALHVAGVHTVVGASRHDADAAAWWRQVAATAELAAQWYDRRTLGGAS